MTRYQLGPCKVPGCTRIHGVVPLLAGLVLLIAVAG